MLLAAAFDRAYPDDSWINLLGVDFRDEILARQQAAAHWDVIMPLTTFADLGHLIYAAELSPAVQDLIGPIKTDNLLALTERT